jgi:hypothetical protein
MPVTTPARTRTRSAVCGIATLATTPTVLATSPSRTRKALTGPRRRGPARRPTDITDAASATPTTMAVRCVGAADHPCARSVVNGSDATRTAHGARRGPSRRALTEDPSEDHGDSACPTAMRVESRQNENHSRSQRQGERHVLGGENQTRVRLVRTETRETRETGRHGEVTAESNPQAAHHDDQPGRNGRDRIRLRYQVSASPADRAKVPAGQRGQLSHPMQREAAHQDGTCQPRDGGLRRPDRARAPMVGDQDGQSATRRGEVRIKPRQPVGPIDSCRSALTEAPPRMSPKRIRFHRPVPPSLRQGADPGAGIRGRRGNRQPGRVVGRMGLWLPVAFLGGDDSRVDIARPDGVRENTETATNIRTTNADVHSIE